MDLGTLLVRLAEGQFHIAPDGAELLVRPAHRLTPELIAAIREHKDRLLAARCDVCGVRSGGYGTCPQHDPFREEGPDPCA